MRYFFIVNPAAAHGRAGQMWPALERRIRSARVTYGAALTKGPGDATRIAREEADRWDALVAAGGDGTIREVLTGAVGATACLGCLPLGTGNDLVRTLGLPLKPTAALAALLQGVPRAMDVGWVNGAPFLNVAGVGFDADVARAVQTAARPVRGTLPYLWTVLRLLASNTNRPMVVRAPGFERTGPTFLVAVGNCRFYGGGMHVCPLASPTDGLLDVCLAQDLSTRAILGALVGIYRGRHLKRRDVSYFRAPELTIDGPADVFVHADGDIVGSLPATFRVEPAAIRCLWPA